MADREPPIIDQQAVNDLVTEAVTAALFTVSQERQAQGPLHADPVETLQVIVHFHGPVYFGNDMSTKIDKSQKAGRDIKVDKSQKAGGHMIGVAQGKGNKVKVGDVQIQEQAGIDKELATLEKQVAELIEHLQKTDLITAAQVKAHLDAVKIVAKASPEDREKNRPWYSVSKQGLLDAADAVKALIPKVAEGVKATLGAIGNLAP